MFWILKADNGGNMEISKIIKEARIKKGMTQQELADSVYVTRQTISKWELGKSIPDELSFRLLCQCLEIDNNVRKKIVVNKQHLFLIMIAIMFSPVVLGIRYILYKIGKLEDQRFIIMIKSVGFVLFALYFRTLKEHVAYILLLIIVIGNMVYQYYLLSLER